ncbi:Nucleosome assembly protein (NAP) [Phytophthora cactorum]|nr:Nucleosome assembly protein (NAP) [Phytophthora cactorum]
MRGNGRAIDQVWHRWGFHAVTLASGTADAALAAKRELLNRLKANSELTSWTRGCSYRVVDRTELEELVRVAHAEEVEVKRREEKAPEEAASDQSIEPSIFQTANGIVKVLYEAAQVGGVEWSDFTFTNVTCSTEASVIKQPEDLEQELVNTVEMIAAQKFAFKDWVASTKFSVIPSFQKCESDELFKKYESMLSGVFPGSIATSTVLFSIIEAVATTSSPRTVSFSPCYKNQSDPSQFEEFLEHGDLVACRVASAQLYHEALQAEGIHAFYHKENTVLTTSNEPYGSEAICPVDARKLLAGKLQSRAFFEKLTRAVLPQRIALVLQQNSPDTYSSYYAPTDSLLLAYLPKTAPGRMEVSSWVARDHVRHRPAFKYWKREHLNSQEYLTPRTEAAAGACVPLSAGQLAHVATQTWSMYPADHSVVRLYRTLRGFFIASFKDDSALYTSEGRRKYLKKPDKFSTITVTNSFPSGLTVSACSDGCVTQRYTQKTSEKWGDSSVASDRSGHGAKNGLQTKHNEDEKYRVVYGKGSVLRVLRCGRSEVMLASGMVRVVRACKNHHHWSRKPTGHDTDVHPPLVTTLTVDPETNALIERRPNGVIIVTFTSGARVTYHVDGTRMYMNAGSTHVLVKKRGFADVCIDMEVNVTAQHHAAGERVAVTKGGLCVRSIVNIYDGTSVEISYNTKVTAQVNGRVTTRKPSGQVVVAKDSGRVEYNSLDRSSFASKDDDDRDVTSHNAVYYFDCRHGQFQLCDNEQNQFHVNFSGTDEETGPTVAVDLAGVVSESEAARYAVDSIPAKAVINEPIQPHIFVLNGDGTGVEILRPQDIAEFIESAPSENQVRELTDAGSSIPRLHVFLRRLISPGTSRLKTHLFNDPQLHEEMLNLQRPVGTAGKYLPNYFDEVKHASLLQQFTTVRRVEQIQPLCTDELDEMHAGWAKWEQWQKDREANKECYKVVDPRQPDVIAQEIAMQRKVMAAYKAARARKKMARQKAREMKAKSVSQEMSPGRMETVQEGEEALEGEGDDEEHSDDEFGQFGSDMSDDDVGDTVEVDDPMELLWSAFSQADVEGRGLLSIAQTRLGVANVLGIGVTTNELTEALVRFKLPYPFNRQRTDDNTSDEKVVKVLESVKKVEEELEKVNVEQAKEILVIETKYNAKKRPTYVKRNKLLADIPHFWKQVTFQENPYFSPTTLWKQVKFSEDGEEVEVTATELTWKDKAEMTEDSEKFPFFQVC